jgi:hypothetical protein
VYTKNDCSDFYTPRSVPDVFINAFSRRIPVVRALHAMLHQFDDNGDRVVVIEFDTEEDMCSHLNQETPYTISLVPLIPTSPPEYCGAFALHQFHKGGGGGFVLGVRVQQKLYVRFIENRYSETQ